MKKFLLFTTCMVSVGCATSIPKPKLISYEEASSFERSLLARELVLPKEAEQLYIQPVNKKEACKLPTAQDQLDRANFRAYWDGECRNGFAFGLGRDMAISDTHHLEEITIYDGTGAKWSQPRVTYDYVNNSVMYTVAGSKFPALVQFIETINNSISGFNVNREIRTIDESGKVFMFQAPVFHPRRVYLSSRIDNSIGYRFIDDSVMPVMKPDQTIFTVEIVDPKSNTIGGVAIAKFANGSVLHFKVINSRPTENIVLPKDYSDYLYGKYQDILSATSQADSILQKARQIEREYLFKACSGKNGINGLDNAVYTKICTWRDQYKEPYATALASYQKQLESLKQQATYEEQKRLQQQQIIQQKKQQESTEAWANIANSASQVLNSVADGYNKQANMYNSMSKSMSQMPSPVIQPITPFNTNKKTYNCIHVGISTNCKEQ